MIEVNFYGITDDRNLGSFFLPTVPRKGDTVYIATKNKTILVDKVENVINLVDGQTSFYVSIKGFYL